MLSSLYFAIASTLIAAKFSSASESTQTRPRIFGESEDSRYYERNGETLEPDEQREIRNVEENTWRESTREELNSATSSNGYASYSYSENDVNERANNNRQSIGDGWRDAAPGKPGMDYPIHNTIPVTSFSCVDKEPGGYYADVETGCQVFHVCNTGGVKSSFLCPPGSIFNQKYFVCDWWYGFNCQEAVELYTKKSIDSSDNSNDEYQDYSINEKFEDKTDVTGSTELTKNIGTFVKVYPKDSEIQSYNNRMNDFPVTIGGQRKLNHSKQSVRRNDDETSGGFENLPSTNYEISKSHQENRVKSDNAPRGFARDRYHTLDNINTIKSSRVNNDHKNSYGGSTNDLASYVNYAYFEAELKNKLFDNSGSHRRDRDDGAT